MLPYLLSSLPSDPLAFYLQWTCNAQIRPTTANCYKFGHGFQLRAHSNSVRLLSTTHSQLLRTQGHVYSYTDTPLP
jgi:hypothetical protein